MIQYAKAKRWDRVHDGVVEQMKQIGYRDAVYAIGTSLKFGRRKLKSTRYWTTLKLAQMDIKELFKGMTLDQGGVGHGNDTLRTSGDSGSPTAKRAVSTSYAAQQIREQEIKINAMEDVLEEALTCCITQEIMIDPVATLDGNVYERKQIENGCERAVGQTLHGKK